MSTIDPMVKRERGPSIIIYCTAKEREALNKAAEKAGLSRHAFILKAALAAGGEVMYLPADLARMVRAEAKRRKLEPETLLAMWIGAAAERAGKDGE